QGSFQQCPYAGDQLSHLERFCQVIVSSGRKSLLLVVDVDPPRQHEDASAAALFSDLFAQFHAAYLWQNQVQNNKIEFRCGDKIRRETAIALCLDGVMLLLQPLPDSQRQPDVILNYENLSHDASAGPFPQSLMEP